MKPFWLVSGALELELQHSDPQSRRRARSKSRRPASDAVSELRIAGHRTTGILCWRVGWHTRGGYIGPCTLPQAGYRTRAAAFRSTGPKQGPGRMRCLSWELPGTARLVLVLTGKRAYSVRGTRVRNPSLTQDSELELQDSSRFRPTAQQTWRRDWPERRTVRRLWRNEFKWKFTEKADTLRI